MFLFRNKDGYSCRHFKGSLHSQNKTRISSDCCTQDSNHGAAQQESESCSESDHGGGAPKASCVSPGHRACSRGGYGEEGHPGQIWDGAIHKDWRWGVAKGEKDTWSRCKSHHAIRNSLRPWTTRAWREDDGKESRVRENSCPGERMPDGLLSPGEEGIWPNEDEEPWAP